MDNTDEIFPQKFRELTASLRQIKRLTRIAFTLTYLWTLFFINVGFIILYDRLYQIDFSSPSDMGIVAAIFTLVTLADLVLLLKDKVTPSLLVWVIVLAPFLAVYKFFKESDFFNLNLNKNSTPAKIRKYIFP